MNWIRPHRWPSRASLSNQEGFSLIELMVALGVILIAVIAMVYTITVSMSNVAYARQRDGANALADRTMEQIRALPFATIQAGLSNTDLSSTTDPNILKSGQGGCPSGAYCFPVTPSAAQCPSGVPGYGERIPHGTNANVTPLVPHQTTAAVGPTTYLVSTYISYLCNVMTNNTFRVTVIVSWANPAVNGVSAKVATQSIFYSQSGGCVGSQTHPYAAPCQPFFYGTADVQNGAVGIDGAVPDLGAFDPKVNPPLSLDLPEFTSNLSIEQITAAQGVSTTSGVSLDMDGSSPVRAGYEKDTTGADNDPAQPGQTYQQTSPNPKTGPAATPVSANGGGSSLTLTSSGGDTHGSTSTTDGTLSNQCNNGSGTTQTDDQACGNASTWQKGTLTAVLNLNAPGGSLGDATLASVGGASARSYGFTNRDVTPQPGTCAGTSGDGCIHADATRSIGTFALGGFPANVPGPAGWNGSLIQVTNFTDSTSAESGVGGANPTATASGTLSYWNGAGYTTCTIGTDCPATVTTPRISVVAVVGGSGSVQVLIPPATWTVNKATTTKNVPPSAPDTLPACVAANTCTANASGTSTSPVSGSLRYVVNFIGSGTTTLADLTLNVDLGTLAATTRYKPAN
jgi:prepilin-type N-terminal cleavage/methylation domain-containing protein